MHSIVEHLDYLLLPSAKEIFRSNDFSTLPFHLERNSLVVEKTHTDHLDAQRIPKKHPYPNLPNAF